MSDRFTCEYCGIFFGRFHDYAKHSWVRHPKLTVLHLDFIKQLVRKNAKTN
jgi:hypothetical protein